MNIDKLIKQTLKEEMIRYRDKILVIGPKDKQGNKTLYHKDKPVGYMRPDYSIEITEEI